MRGNPKRNLVLLLVVSFPLWVSVLSAVLRPHGPKPPAVQAEKKVDAVEQGMEKWRAEVARDPDYWPRARRDLCGKLNQAAWRVGHTEQFIEDGDTLRIEGVLVDGRYAEAFLHDVAMMHEVRGVKFRSIYFTDGERGERVPVR